MTLHVGAVTIDCEHPAELAKFWTAALSIEVLQDFMGEYMFLGSPSGEGIRMGLQRADEERTVKNRVHLDLVADDRHAEVARLVGLGATQVEEHEVPGLSWTVLTDPEGNVFCVGTPTQVT